MPPLYEIPVAVEDNPKKTIPIWDAFYLENGRYCVRRLAAWTKSEARAQMKKYFGVDRLPVGFRIVRDRLAGKGTR